MANSEFVEQVETLQQHYQNQKKLPPVELWNPPLSGDMDMLITSDGRWYHEGDEIKRWALAKLFSTILKKEGDEYFLVTPVEKWRIKVEDAPFVVVAMEVVGATNEHPAHLLLTTNTDDKVLVDSDHPLWVKHDKNTGEPRPYVIVRHDMPALLNRNVYYQLIDIALKDSENADNVGIWSCGEFFKLD